MQVWRRWDPGLARSQLLVAHPELAGDPEEQQDTVHISRFLARKTGSPTARVGRESLLPLTHWHQTPLRPSPGQAPPNHLAACPSTDFKADFHSNPRHCRPSPEGNYPQEGTVRAKDSIQGSPGRWQVSHFSTVESLNRFCEIKASLWSSEELLWKLDLTEWSLIYMRVDLKWLIDFFLTLKLIW